MNTEETARLETGGCDGPGNERGLQLACDGRLSRRSVEILHDLGLSQEKIVAYNLRFPTPTPVASTAGVENAAMTSSGASEGGRQFDPCPGAEDRVSFGQ